MSNPRVAVFRPDDDRLRDAIEILESLGTAPVADPMLAVDPTGRTPGDADWAVFTSKTGVELAAETGWSPSGALACIGPATARAAREAGWTVDLVPDEYSSAGLVEALAERVSDQRVEIVRSDHGSSTLPEGLLAADAEVDETVLYRLVRPADAGASVEYAATGDLEAAAFTSSLTVEHFIEAATERGLRDAAVTGLADAVVGVIGEPTRETAETAGISVDVVPPEATFEELARAVVESVVKNGG